MQAYNAIQIKVEHLLEEWGKWLFKDSGRVKGYVPPFVWNMVSGEQGRSNDPCISEADALAYTIAMDQVNRRNPLEFDALFYKHAMRHRLVDDVQRGDVVPNSLIVTLINEERGKKTNINQIPAYIDCGMSSLISVLYTGLNHSLYVNTENACHSEREHV